MINYTTSTIREQIKDVFLHQGETDNSIVQILDVTKTGNTFVEKEIYPGPAIKLHMTTNYDTASRVEKMPDSAYDAPVIVPANDNYEDLIVTVTPYPPSSSWKLACSNNVVLSDTAKRVFKGKQSVAIKFTDDRSVDRTDYCWIKPVQATSDISPCETSLFRFFVKRSQPSEQAVSSATPLYKWSFNGETPLIDEVRGESLNKNLWNPHGGSAEHFVTGVNKTGLAKTNETYPTSILIGSTMYYRDVSNDTDTNVSGIYAWINDASAIRYTSSATPEEGSPLYDANDQVIANETVSAYNATSVANEWHTDTLDIVNEGDEDGSNTEITLSLYTRHIREGWIGFENGPKINWSYYTYGIVAATNVGFGIINDTQPAEGGWNFWAICRSRLLDPTNPDHAYTAEKGWGFVTETGLRWETYLPNNVGSKAAYTRDSSKDTGDYYAWSWVDPTLDGTYETPPYTTIYTQTEEPVWCTTKQFTNVYIEDETSESGFKQQGRCQIYYFRWTYRDDRYNEVRENNQPYLKSWWNGANNYNAPLKYYFGVYCNNGYRWSFSMNHSSWLGTNEFLKIKFWEEETQNKDKIDELNIFNKMLLPSQIVELAGFCEFTSSSSATTNLIGLSVYHKQQLEEFSIGDSTYSYDPDYTIYWDSSESKGRLGWRKLSGTGPDFVWTESFLPTKNNKCYAAPDDQSTDSNLVISSVSSYNYRSFPMKCKIEPYIIDDHTIAIVVATHSFIENRYRAHYQEMECVQWDYEQNRENWQGDYAYIVNQAVSLNLWDVHNSYQPIIVQRMDDISNYDVDGDSVTFAGRFYTCVGLFRTSCIQFRNSKPGDPYYAKGMYSQGIDFATGDYNHIAYLTLPEPMKEGSTHTVTWFGNSATFTYSKDQPCYTIKVNHEGYLPWTTSRKFAYMGCWLGSGEAYEPTIENFTFYLMPTWANDVSQAVFSSTMTERCRYRQSAGGGRTSDVMSSGKPLDGENVYQIDFSGYNSTTKEAITLAHVIDDVSASGKTYFRDYLEDFTAACITVNGRNYYRTMEKDTCNCFAWVDAETLAPPTGGSSFSGPSILYTNMHIPEVDEKCKVNYDDDPSDEYIITAVQTIDAVGWTTERATINDWANYKVVFMKKSDYTGGNIASAEVYTNHHLDTFGNSGSGIPIANYSASTVTNDISGEYQIYIPHIGWSYKFLISNQSWGHMYWTYMRGMFHERSGCATVKHPYTNWEYPNASHEMANEGGYLFDMSQSTSVSYTWQVDPNTLEPVYTEAGGLIPLGHDGRTSAFNILKEQDKYPALRRKLYGVYGGWFDAADFDTRPTHMKIIQQFANAYLRFPDNFIDNQLDIPESGDGIPDILSEAMWGADLYRRQQTPDGGVGGWVETKQHENDWPWRSRFNYYLCAPSRTISLHYAYVISTLARALRLAATKTSDPAVIDKLKKLVDMYTESACAAWNFGTIDCVAPYELKPKEERTVVYVKTADETFAWLEKLDLSENPSKFAMYGDFSFGDNAFLAAMSLYCLTKEPRFKAWISDKGWKMHDALDSSNANWISNLTPFDLILDLHDEFPSISDKARQKWIRYADQWIGHMDANTYRICNWTPGHSYMNYINYGVHMPETRMACLIAAWCATNNTKYRDALCNVLDHQVGCNCMNCSWTVGLGHNGPPRFTDHHFARSITELGKWSPRIGITPWHIANLDKYNGNANNNAQLIAMTPRHDAYKKGSYQFNGADFVLAPHDIVTRFNGDNRTLRDNYFYTEMPAWRYNWNFIPEGYYNGICEFTIDSSFSLHCVIAGILMGPGWKPRSWYKQIAPVDKCEDVDGWMHLP